MTYEIEIDPRELKPNPYSQEIFGDVEDGDQLNSDIEKRGIQDKPQISTEKEILSGHRRVSGAIKNNIKSITCIVRDDLTTKDAKEEFILKDNAYRRHLNDFQLAKIGAELEKIYKTRHGGDRQSPSFQDGKITHLEGPTRDIVANTLGISGRTYYNIKTATKLAEEHNDQAAIQQLKTEKRCSSRILKRYTQQKLMEQFTVRNLAQQISNNIGDLLPESEWKAYSNSKFTVVPKFAALDKSLSDHFNCRPAVIPNLDSKGQAICNFSLNILQDMMILAKKEGSLKVAINDGKPVKVELQAIDFFFLKPKGEGNQNEDKRSKRAKMA